MVKLKHYDLLNCVRFVTFSCFRYRRLLTETRIFKDVLTELEYTRAKYQLAILGYVLMPNHVHLVILPQEITKIGRVIGEFKWRSARQVLKRWKCQNRRILARIQVIRNGRIGYSVWQRRCYDHNCRSADSVREKIQYCHMNPVRAGLVKDAYDWPWSSYRWYQGKQKGIVTIADMDLL